MSARPVTVARVSPPASSWGVPVTGPARVRAADPPRDSSVEFSDGITLDTATGTVVSGHYRGEQAIRANRMAIENEQVVPRIDGYVRRLEVAASAHEWDCVDCIDGGARDHLIEHLDGRFYPAALLRHATPQWRSLPPRQLRQALHEYLTDRLTLRAPLYAAA